MVECFLEISLLHDHTDCKHSMHPGQRFPISQHLPRHDFGLLVTFREHEQHRKIESGFRRPWAQLKSPLEVQQGFLHPSEFDVSDTEINFGFWKLRIERQSLAQFVDGPLHVAAIGSFFSREERTSRMPRGLGAQFAERYGSCKRWFRSHEWVDQ